MRFLLAAVVGGLFGVVLGTLPSSLRAINEQIGGVLVDQIAVGNFLAIALGRHFQIGQCAPQHRQQPMNPVVGLRLAQSKLQAVQGLQRIGLLIDQNQSCPIYKLLI